MEMAHPKFVTLLLLSTLAGSVGGLIGATWHPPAPGFAQVPADEQRTIVRAEEFHLVDRLGKVRARMAFSAEGHPYLSMNDESGTSIVWLGLSNESGLAIHDVDGKTRLVLSIDSTGQPSLVVRDRQHRTNSFHP
jgi:hypothetical protein